MDYLNKEANSANSKELVEYKSVMEVLACE